jgi:hypothetical protein
MSGFVVGPLAQLRRAEKVILAFSAAGVAGVVVFAATELLLHVLL